MADAAGSGYSSVDFVAVFSGSGYSSVDLVAVFTGSGYEAASVAGTSGLSRKPP